MTVVDKSIHLIYKGVMKNTVEESSAASLAAVMGDMPSHYYRIFVSPGVAARALELADDDVAAKFVKEMNEIIPPDWHGHKSHRVGVGVEYTRVIYLEISKAYFPAKFDEDGLKDALSKLAKKFKCDESMIQRDDASALHWRFWWD